MDNLPNHNEKNDIPHLAFFLCNQLMNTMICISEYHFFLTLAQARSLLLAARFGAECVSCKLLVASVRMWHKFMPRLADAPLIAGCVLTLQWYKTDLQKLLVFNKVLQRSSESDEAFYGSTTLTLERPSYLAANMTKWGYLWPHWLCIGILLYKRLFYSSSYLYHFRIYLFII